MARPEDQSTGVAQRSCWCCLDEFQPSPALPWPGLACQFTLHCSLAGWIGGWLMNGAGRPEWQKLMPSNVSTKATETAKAKATATATKAATSTSTISRQSSSNENNKKLWRGYDDEDYAVDRQPQNVERMPVPKDNCRWEKRVLQDTCWLGSQAKAQSKLCPGWASSIHSWNSGKEEFLSFSLVPKERFPSFSYLDFRFRGSPLSCRIHYYTSISW